jgi:hypothetical protein
MKIRIDLYNDHLYKRSDNFICSNRKSPQRMCGDFAINDQFTQIFYSPVATTMAMPFSRLWLKLTAQTDSPSSCAILSAAPCRTRYGSPLHLCRVSTSRHDIGPMPVPSALEVASLAANRTANASARPRHSKTSSSVKTRFRKRSPCRSRAAWMRGISIISIPVLRIILVVVTNST